MMTLNALLVFKVLMRMWVGSCVGMGVFWGGGGVPWHQ